jgi:hypothetical protein
LEAEVAYSIEADMLGGILSLTDFASDGDWYERSYVDLIRRVFPNCETFWQYVVVPLTNRIVSEITDPSERIRPRQGTSDDLQDIASFHYSMFLHFAYAYDHIRTFRLCSFEDFYVHLGSACDLAEETVLRIHLVILECRGQYSETLQKLSKEAFLEIAAAWYEEHYSDVYENYIKKGKPPPMKLPGRRNVLDEYFGKSEPWMEYKRYSQKIREHRNVIVHDAKIGKLGVHPAMHDPSHMIVPKKERIRDYKTWRSVFAAQQDPKKMKRDFISMADQMHLDIQNLGATLSNLWETPISDLKGLLFNDRNQCLLEKYNLKLT